MKMKNAGTDIIHLKEESNKMAENPDSANNLLADFIALMIHDLQAPLASMKTLLRFLEKRKFDPDNKTHQDLLKSTGIAMERSEAIINDMLDAATAEKAGISINLGYYDVADIVNNSINMIRESALEHNIKIHSRFQADPARVRADRNLLLRVMDNLLFNALKHAPQGSEVLVETELSSDQVIVAIKDSGSGFGDINTEDLFDKYKQADLRKAGKYRGVGLGLYFCRLVLKAMEGKIWAEPNPGGGACFKFALAHRKG
jgi:K+-sensing histidine kinase KdpD